MVKRLAAVLLLAVFGIVAGLALAEVGMRLAGITFPVFDAYDELRGVALRPGKEGWYRREGEAYLRINSLGYRDVEHAVARPSDVFRIAVIGDSFAEARQVALEETFWSHTGRNLGTCPALAGRQVEVLNFGIGGYATTEELLTFRKDAIRFSPSLVVLAFYAANDVHDNSKELSQGTDWRMSKPLHVRASNGDLVLDTSFRGSTWRRFLYEGIHRFRLMEVVNQARRAWTVRQLQRDAARTKDQAELGSYHKIYTPPGDAAWRDAWLVTEALLSRFNDEVKAGGARFAVMTVTMPEQVHPDPAVRADLERRLGVADLLYPDRSIVDIGQRHGFPVIPLAEPLQAIASRDRAYLHGFKNTVMGEGHWNELGHRTAARVLSDQICGSVLAPGA